jgi:membrane-associated phospholipid phosphatase
MTVVRRILVSGLVFLAGGGAVVLLAPGGLGTTRAQVVTDGPSAQMYRAVVAAAQDAPGWLIALGERLALVGLLILAVLLARAGWSGWRHRTPAAAGAPLVGVCIVMAYLASEAAKLVIDEDRPCRVFGEPATWVPCPPAGDWSFPSNHATVAGALAAGLVLLVPRLAVVAVPTAAAVAGMRVVTGVHYPHDVVAGLLLGASVTAALLIALAPALEWLVGAVRSDRTRPSARQRTSDLR